MFSGIEFFCGRRTKRTFTQVSLYIMNLHPPRLDSVILVKAILVQVFFLSVSELVNHYVLYLVNSCCT